MPYPRALALTFWGLLAVAVPEAAGEPPPPPRERPELAVQFSHSWSIDAFALSPDGTLMLTGGDDYTVCLWEVQTGLVVRHFLGNTSYVSCVAFSPDGTRAASGSRDGTARVWDVRSGKQLQVFRGRAGQFNTVNSVAFSPDGKRLLSGASDWDARLWDVETGKEVARFPNKGIVNTVAFAPGGRQVFVAVADSARLLDAETGKESVAFEGHKGTVCSAAFSADGRRLLTGTFAGVVRLWDRQSGRELRRFDAGGTYAVAALSADGRRVLTGREYDARLWDAETGKKLHEWHHQLYGVEGAVERIVGVAMSADGKRALTGSQGGARLWDADDGRLLRDYPKSRHWKTAAAWHPEGDKFWLLCNDTAILWSAAEGRTVRRFVQHPEWSGLVRFSPDGSRAITQGPVSAAEMAFAVGEGKQPESHPPVLWDAGAARPLRRLYVRAGRDVTDAAFTRDGKRLLLATDEQLVFVYDAENARLARVLHVGVHAKEMKVQTFKTDGTVQEGVQKNTDIRAMAFSPDGRRILTSGFDQTIVWDVESGKQLARFDPVRSAAFSPDAKRLLTAGEEEAGGWALVLRDGDTGKPVRRLGEGPQTRNVHGFSDDGKRALTSGAATTQVWDVEAGKPAAALPGRGGEVWSASFSPDGKRVLTSLSDQSAVLWDADRGREVCTLLNTPEGLFAATPEHYYLAPPAALRYVAFRTGLRCFPFEQFDLKYNRPDKVLAAIGAAPDDVVEACEHLYRNRLAKMHLTEGQLADDFRLPEVAVTSPVPLATKESTLRLRVRASDAEHPLDRLLVAVNGVPVGGSNGIALKGSGAKAWEGEVVLDLSAGRNAVRVSVLNARGVESLRRAFDVACETPAEPPTLYVVAVGVSEYKDARYNLRYAAKDARDLVAYFESLAGPPPASAKGPRPFGRVVVRPVLDRDATRENVRKARELLNGSKVNDAVVVFLAGHGLLGDKLDYYFGTHDVDFKHPDRQGLAYADLEALLDGIPARRKLLLMDTCHAGEFDRDDRQLGPAPKAPDGAVTARGFRGLDLYDATRERAARAGLADGFADLRRGTGAVVIAAAGGAEYALESPEWGNGVFTYAVLKGLRDRAADRNRDGVVRVSELREYVLRDVERLTRGRQRPVIRGENLEAALGDNAAADFPLNGP